MNLKSLLEAMTKINASDLHIKVNNPPVMRVYSRLRAVDHPKLTNDEISKALHEIMPTALRPTFEHDGAVDFAHELPGLARFRVAAFHQRGSISIVFRLIKLKIPSFDELNLPKSVAPLANLTYGMVLVTGITGSGKSTTLASLIQKINDTRRVHIVTVEDPVEYVYQDNMALINQMEVGPDCPSFNVAMRRILRFDPDSILIGEIRDRETIETALEATDTGHLVFSTLHTSDAKETITRILHFFTINERQMILDSLAHNLKAVLSQRLMPRIDTQGIVPAVEVMLSVPIIQKLIKEDRVPDIQQVLKNQESGMQSFDVSLALLVRQGYIAQDEALLYTGDPAGLRRMIRGEFSAGDKSGLIGGF